MTPSNTPYARSLRARPAIPAVPLADDRAKPIHKAFSDALRVARQRARGEDLPIQTPWPSLNELLGGGLWPGLHVLVGATGVGRTQLALQIALAAAEQGVTTRYVSLELGSDEVAMRVAALARGTGEWSALYFGRDTAGIDAAAAEVAPRLDGLPFQIEEGTGRSWTANHLADRAETMRIVSERSPLVVVDYLQLVGSATGTRDLREVITEAAVQAREAARRGATVLLISSVSRDKIALLKGPDRRRPGDDRNGDPTDLVGIGKESGDIEYSADTVLAVSTGGFSPGSTATDVAVAKHRAGRPGWVELTFDGTRFAERGLRVDGKGAARGL